MRKKISDIYDDVIFDIRNQGIKVHHKKQGKDTAGSYDPETDLIEIDPQYRRTKRGIFTLLHEFAHYQQHREGKFTWFFNNVGDEAVSDIRMKEVFEAEIDASKRALKIMKQYGIFDFIPEELNDNADEQWLYEFYKKNYFKSKNKKTKM